MCVPREVCLQIPVYSLKDDGLSREEGNHGKRGASEGKVV